MARGGSRVRLKGPLFDSRRTIVLVGMDLSIYEAITKYALRAVNRILKAKIRKPTPIYQELIDIRQGDKWRVTDFGGVAYNHWLEGTGSRNFPVTSFKGYHAFGRAYALTEARAGKLAQTKVGQAVRKLGGRSAGGGQDGAGD